MSADFSERLIPSPWYSEDGTYVFQNTSLPEIISEYPAFFAYLPLKEKLPALLEITEKFYRSELSTAHNKDYYETAVRFTRRAMEDYEAGRAKIIMFYGKYEDKKIILEFEK